jgi:hypothetical protein
MSMIEQIERFLTVEEAAAVLHLSRDRPPAHRSRRTPGRPYR